MNILLIPVMRTYVQIEPDAEEEEVGDCERGHDKVRVQIVEVLGTKSHDHFIPR